MKLAQPLLYLALVAVLLAAGACGAQTPAAPVPTAVAVAAATSAPSATVPPSATPEPATPTRRAPLPAPSATPVPTEAVSATVSVTQTATITTGLTLEALQNATYPSEYTGTGQVALVDGKFEMPAATGSAITVVVQLADQYATGDLNGDGTADAAVILVSSPGGSGTFYDLAAVIDDNGTPAPVATTLLGDRVKIQSIAILDGEITVHMIAQGPNDPLCCPTNPVTKQYRLEGDRLVDVSPAEGAPAPTTGASGTFTDPFAYCAATGTIDAPDQRFVGPKVPPAIAAGLQKALGLTGTPAPPVAENSVWRCMDGKVYACTIGANLPCTEKADTNRTPTQAMADFCQANPASDFIPAVVTGRATVYEWRCTDGKPEIVRQMTNVDAQGFQADIWYEIMPAGQ